MGLNFIEDFYHEDDKGDFSPAIERAIASTGSNSTPTGFSLYFKNQEYHFSRTIRLNRAMSLIGSGSAGWFAGTRFVFPAGVTGLFCQYDFTHTKGMGPWSIVERIKFDGGNQPAGQVAHGIFLQAKMAIRDSYITGFNGDGIHIEASTPVGNANNWVISNVRIDGCGGDGLFVTGSDANAGCATTLDSSENNGWGIRETSTLGNTYLACHCADNQSGAYTTRNKTGASDRNARSMFLNCYVESPQGSQVDDPSIVLGGDLNLTPDSTCVQLGSYLGLAVFDNGVIGSNRKTAGVQAILGSDPGVALSFVDPSLREYRLHAPSSDNWWQLKWAELDDAIPIRLSSSPQRGSNDVPAGNLWMENGFYLGAAGARIRVLTANEKPTDDGTAHPGDLVMNANPASGGYAGWIYTAKGRAQFGKID